MIPRLWLGSCCSKLSTPYRPKLPGNIVIASDARVVMVSWGPRSRFLQPKELGICVSNILVEVVFFLQIKDNPKINWDNLGTDSSFSKLPLAEWRVFYGKTVQEFLWVSVLMRFCSGLHFDTLGQWGTCLSKIGIWILTGKDREWCWILRH